jgi:phage/plasmid-like protein (TIGR03299 family)
MEMSLETREDLQRNFLIGNCKHRPRAWHNDPALRARLGLEDNHYDDPIPYSEVVRRLFNWKALSVPKANLIPCAKADANWFMETTDENGEKVVMPVRVSPTDSEQGIVRSDTFEHIATHSDKYRIHDYEAWLLQLQSNVIGDTLTVLGAGLPRRGAQAYVQVALPDTAKDDKTGVEFMPYIMASTSLDGSLPTTFSAQSLLVVCDNTRNMALRAAERSGRIYKAKHTSKSLDANRIADVRQALGIIHKTADDMIAEFRELSAIPINRRQVIKVLDIILPLPKDDEASQRSIKIMENKRDSFLDVYYDRDPDTKGMMANQQNTLLGLVQGFNTWNTHVKSLKGNRFERNMERAISGDFGDFDIKVMEAAAHVLDRPDLVSSK